MKLIVCPLLILLCFAQCSKSDSNNAVVPVLSSSQVTQAEGNGGNTPFVFTFRLSVASTKTISVNVKSSDGFAKAGEDYIAVDQALQFNPGETEKQLTVNVVGDDIREGKDNFSLVLSNPLNCTLGSSSYSCLILNDDTKIPITDAGYTTPSTYPGLTMTWSDEFNGTSLNTGDWNYETGDGCPNCGWGNNELEYYTGGDNVYLQSGKLFIEAREEVLGGKSYTSSRITTKSKKFFKFGRIDIRAKVPSGQGVWPAIWMMPQENKYGNWPTSGEMDIMELLGHEPNKVYSTLHYGPGPGSQNISRSKVAATPYSDEFHVYSMIWVQDKVTLLVDEAVISIVNKADIGGNTYPFNETFFFIFNVAVGGNWPGSPNASTYFPQWLAVDYVRVFQ